LSGPREAGAVHRILLTGGCILSLDRRLGNLRRGDLLIDGTAVKEVGESLSARGAEVIDATDCIVMPGFVDTHRHLWESLFRNRDDPHQQVDALLPGLPPDDLYAATLIGLLGAADAGITSVVDWSGVALDSGQAEAALQAHLDARLRSVLALAPGRDGWADLLSRLAQRAGGEGSEVRLAFGPPEPAPADLDRAAADWALARQAGARIHTHAASKESPSVPVELANRGLLGGDVTLARCTDIDEAGLEAIGKAGAALAITPASDMAAGEGFPPLQKLIDRGIRPGLGIESERSSPGDMFAQMRATISMQHARFFDLKLAGKAGLPNLLTTRDVIRYATVDGSRVAGLEGGVGSLHPGNQADIVVLRADRPNVFPVNDPIGAVVWGMDTSNVDWVFVAGRALKRAGQLQADIDRARELAMAAVRREAGEDAGRSVGTAAAVSA
jgi:cytosine/adenosine deaminase-related metal-dependent hydrolase